MNWHCIVGGIGALWLGAFIGFGLAAVIAAAHEEMTDD